MPGDARNITQRNIDQGQYEALLRRDLGNEADAYDGANQEYNESRDDSRTHEAKAGFDEKGRLTELNSEYVDVMQERYIHQVLGAEQQSQEKKYGRGWLGGVRRWLEETDGGKIVKGVVKGGLAAAAFLATPFTQALGVRLGVDTAGEQIQYWVAERPILNRIRDLKRTRMQQVLQLTEIKRLLHNDDDGLRHVSETIELQPAPGVIAPPNQDVNLGEALTAIIETLEAVDQQIAQEEAELARVRQIGSTIRNVAGTVASGGFLANQIHNVMTHGMSLGLHDFDKGLPGELPGSHVVRVAGDGVKFIYNSGDYMAGRITENMIGTAGNLGANAPWWAFYGAAVGIGAEVAIPAIYQANQAVGEFGNRQFFERMAANTDGTSPKFSLRGDKRYGNANHELATTFNRVDREGVADDRQATLEALRSQLVPGAIWEWTEPGQTQPTTVEIVRVMGNEIIFYEIDDDGNRKGNFKKYSGDKKIENGKLVADSKEAFLAKNSVDKSVRDAAKTAHVEIPEVGDIWRPNAGTTATIEDLGGNAINVDADHKIKIEQFNKKKTTARISILDKNNKKVRDVIVLTPSLVRSCNPSKRAAVPGAAGGSAEGSTEPEEAIELTEEQEREKQYAEKFENLNKYVRDPARRWAEGVGAGQVWSDGVNWYLIDNVSTKVGTASIYQGALEGGGQPPEMKKLKEGYPDNMTIERLDNIFRTHTMSYRGAFQAQQQKQQGGGNQGGGGGGRGRTR